MCLGDTVFGEHESYDIWYMKYPGNPFILTYENYIYTIPNFENNRSEAVEKKHMRFSKRT